MKMKLNSLSVLCLSFLLLHHHFSFGKRGGGGGGGSIGKSSGSKKSSVSGRGSTHTNTNTGHINNQGSQPKQSGQQPGAGGNHNQDAARGTPHGGGHGGYGGGYGGHGGGHGGHGGGHGGHGGGYGGHGGGYINQHPDNKILSPHYRGSFGYGGHGVRGGSPFSRSVSAMGMFPSDKSRGFGRGAVMAATGGAVAVAAVGYGLGSIPRPSFHFRSRQEEHYYNHYMYRKHGARSTDTNDYSREYSNSDPPPQTYDSYMDSCMERTDLLPTNKLAATATTTTIVPSAPDTVTGSNNTAADNSSTSAPSTPRPLDKSVPPTSQILNKTATDDDDDDTVSIVEIGNPALIKQLKVRKCLELYIVYSTSYLRTTGGVQGLHMCSSGLLVMVTTSTILMLLNSNMQMLLRGPY